MALGALQCFLLKEQVRGSQASVNIKDHASKSQTIDWIIPLHVSLEFTDGSE
jgi:hypothetical protein